MVSATRACLAFRVHRTSQPANQFACSDGGGFLRQFELGCLVLACELHPTDDAVMLRIIKNGGPKCAVVCCTHRNIKTRRAFARHSDSDLSGGRRVIVPAGLANGISRSTQQPRILLRELQSGLFRLGRKIGDPKMAEALSHDVVRIATVMWR